MSAGVHNIGIKLNRTQQAFITSRAEADLFSCRMGEGKSTALCWAIYHHTKHNPGADWALMRDTWTNLEGTTLREFFKWFPVDVMVSWRATEKRITWLPASGLTGSIICLGIADDIDAQKLQSREFAGFAMDEPAPAAESGGIAEFVFSTALTRLRQPGMKWYAAKLAQNSSDETHWTYRQFFDPGNPGNPDFDRPPKQTMGFRVFETSEPENKKNLPRGYFDNMAARYRASGRQDLADRFAGGKVGFQQQGKAVTPEFSRMLHVASGLMEISSAELLLCWDFGLNPTCHMTQATPMGHWNILESYVSDGGMGVYELIEEVIAGRIEARFHGADIRHYGDPAGEAREASSSKMTAVKMIKDLLGGRWTPGPVRFAERVAPLRSVLSKTHNGTGLVQIDEERAKPCWHALRGGWHYRIHRGGVVSDHPVKNISSHPGDAIGYGAAIIYPGGVLKERKRSNFRQLQRPTYGAHRSMLFPPKPEPPKDGAEMFDPDKHVKTYSPRSR